MENQSEKLYGIVYRAIVGGKPYIGCTITGLPVRKSNHKSSVKSGDMKPFYVAIREAGWENVTWETIGEYGNLTDLLDAETLAIKENNTLWPNGYNLCEYGSLHPHTEETKQKNRKASLDFYKNHPEARERARETANKQFSDPKAREKVRENSIKQYSDPEQRKKDSDAKKKYYAETPGAIEKASVARKTAHERKSSDPNYLGWICTNPTGIIYTVKNLTKFCKEYGLDQGSMSHVANGEYSHHRYWTCVREIK